MSGFYWLSQLANGVIYFSVLDFTFIDFRRWMDKSSQLDPRGTGAKNKKWWLDNMKKMFAVICPSFESLLEFIIFL